MTQETLKVQISGNDLITAVSSVIGGKSFVCEKDYKDGVNVWKIGQRSGFPYEHLIVLGDGEEGIDPSKIYTSITVKDHSWGGSVYAVGYRVDEVIDAVKDFALSLYLLLTEKPQILPTDVLTFVYGGKTYKCSTEALKLCKIALPDGRILQVEYWSRANPPMPEGITLVCNATFAQEVT
ncbi:hypothetical protein COV24_02890 [candidate division WWE3 bacterium CG10_big_fil_rev_8_21_14_0_10_32_10]|uniref:Uncharacterized protein n=1 Tax=candidate division WWE3 bacterium CG10_big_fil_rev_8_21_14_0_10_32_10 TaxID=1975090 RepID=A0A2H0RA25_UNCKA|nr:MAG: hypothetical protein COV24_02890 [candidate division WWE3 bacterium CG10_big_fil_rev_8_21_14_0_10_32_10]